MYTNSFVCPSKRSIIAIHTIFNKKHTVVKYWNFFSIAIEDYLRKLKRGNRGRHNKNNIITFQKLKKKIINISCKIYYLNSKLTFLEKHFKK